MEIIEFLRVNSNWIKDIVTIFFMGTGSLIAILTYRRARATILQPKRTEAIKKQTEILSDFLALLSENHNSIDDAFDYVNLFSYNVDLILREYGLIEIENNTETYIEMNSNVAGWLQFLKNDIHDFVFIKGDLNDYDKLIFDKNNRERQKYYFSQLSQGNITTHRIFYTQKYFTFYEALKGLRDNPFVPKEIQDCAFETGKNMFINIHGDLRVILTKLTEEYYNALTERKGSHKIILLSEYRHQELWRVFEKGRNHHDEDYLKLKNKIRKHLLIDDTW